MRLKKTKKIPNPLVSHLKQRLLYTYIELTTDANNILIDTYIGNKRYEQTLKYRRV